MSMKYVRSPASAPSRNRLLCVCQREIIMRVAISAVSPRGSCNFFFDKLMMRVPASPPSRSWHRDTHTQVLIISKFRITILRALINFGLFRHRILKLDEQNFVLQDDLRTVAK